MWVFDQFSENQDLCVTGGQCEHGYFSLLVENALYEGIGNFCPGQTAVVTLPEVSVKV